MYKMVKITYKKFCILVDIYLCLRNDKKYKNFFTSELANMINIKPQDMYFQEICKVLIRESIMIYKETTSRNNYYKMNMKKLNNFIREAETFNKTGEFITASKWDYSF